MTLQHSCFPIFCLLSDQGLRPFEKIKQESSQIKSVRQGEQSHTFHFIYCVESKAWKKWTGLRSQRTEPAFRIQYIRKIDQFACIINWLLFTLGQNCEEQCQVDAKIWPSGFHNDQNCCTDSKLRTANFKLDFNKSKSFLFGTAFVMSKGLKKAKTLYVGPYMASLWSLIPGNFSE